MARFTLCDDFVDRDAERAVLAAIALDPTLLDGASAPPPGAFAAEVAAFVALADAILHGRPRAVPADWTPAPDPQTAVARLCKLRKLRLVADAIETAAAAMRRDGDASPETILEGLARGIEKARSEADGVRTGAFRWASDLVDHVLADAEAKRRLREVTGQAILGVPSGIATLDQRLGGVRSGLAVLAGGPGVGKTTLATQIALHVATCGGMVVYVTYENAPANILLKMICATASVAATDVDRGRADVRGLEEGARALGAALDRVALVEGNAAVNAGRIAAIVRTARRGMEDARCLVVVDYLQRAAHGAGYEQLRQNVSAFAGALRDLATSQDVSVLAICSQNRADGEYGRGGGKANIASLKESGDLEYGADSILFLLPDAGRRADPPAVALDLVVAKNRHGESGFAVPLVFNPERGVMREQAWGGR